MLATPTLRQMMMRGESAHISQPRIEGLDDLLGHRASNGGRTLTPILQELPPFVGRRRGRVAGSVPSSGRYDLLILSAVRYGRVQPLMSFKNPKLHPVLRHLLQGELLVELAAQGLWPCWNGLLSGYTRPQATILLLWLASRPINSPALEAFKMLVGRFLYNRDLLRFVLRETLTGGTSQYEFLLYSDNDIIQRLLRDGSEHTAHLRRLLSYRCSLKSPPQDKLDSHDARIYLACKAGLLSAPPPVVRIDSERSWCTYFNTVLDSAVNSVRLDFVRFAYSTGPFRHVNVINLGQGLRRGVVGRLSQLCRNALYGHHREMPKIIRFQRGMASRVSSLEDTCLVALSRGLGWGRAREAAVVEKLQIAFVLKMSLLRNCDMTLLSGLR